MHFVDSHCHLEFDAFEADRDALLERARQVGVQTMLSIGTRLDSWPQILALAEKHRDIFATLGLHPTDIEAPLLEGLADRLYDAGQHPRVVGFGETGLDFYHTPYDEAQQIKALDAHVEAALRADMPVIIHTRDAEAATTNALKAACQRGPLRGVIHCFSGSQAFAEEMLALGFYISFSGVVTFKNALALQEVARCVPLDRFLIETDAPFLAPQPFRGKRNEPSFVVHTAEKIANLREMTVADVAHHTTANFFTLFQKATRP
jgi:TatD DNase family protein